MAYDLKVTQAEGAAPVSARGLYVCDRAGLLGGDGTAMVPVKAAWMWDTATSSMRQCWPPPPAVVAFGVGSPADWRTRLLTWTAPAATSFTVTARVGALGAETTIYSGTGNSVTWDWFNAGSTFNFGVTVTYKLTATNSGGSTVTEVGSPLPHSAPAPSAAPTYASTDYNSTVASWPAVLGAIDYQVVNAATGNVYLTTTSTSGTLALASPSTTYTFKVRARVQAGWVGAALYTGAESATRSVTSSAAPESGPANGTYTIEPATNATYQWGESGGQDAQWRPTSDELYHGDGGSVSTRGQQAAFFFYGTRITGHAQLGNGLGTKTVSRVQIYVKRMTSGGDSSAQGCRWNLHNYSSKPSGAPTLYSATDIGNLAWGDGEWFDLPTSWGVSLINETRRGIAWGKVASRYMQANSNLAIDIPNGTLKITIAN